MVYKNTCPSVLKILRHLRDSLPSSEPGRHELEGSGERQIACLVLAILFFPFLRFLLNSFGVGTKPLLSSLPCSSLNAIAILPLHAQRRTKKFVCRSTPFIITRTLSESNVSPNHDSLTQELIHSHLVTSFTIYKF